jgi:hypothetical protein
MKTNLHFLFLLFALLKLAVLPARADSLWVHHIGVGQGDATLIIAWQTNAGGGVDTTSILIDAGNSSGKGAAVYTYVNEMLGATRHLNVIITSHLHSDHIGGTTRLLELLSANNWRVDLISDRGAQQQIQLYPDSCYSAVGQVANDTVEPYKLPGSQVYANYVQACDTYYPGKRLHLPLGNNLFTYLQRPPTMRMTLIAGYGCVMDNYYNNMSTCYLPLNPDENDFSLGFLLQFNTFSYFTAGDIGGAPPYLDLETPLVNYFNTFPGGGFHFCGYKASHHGSSNSNTLNFLTNTHPTLTVIPSALRSFNGTQLPGATTITNLQGVNSTLFYTYNYSVSPSSGAITAFVDVAFRVNNAGAGAVAMPVYTRQRSKTSPYAPTGPFVYQSTVSCAQHVAAQAAPDSAAGSSGVVEHPALKRRQVQRLKKSIERKQQRLQQLQTGAQQGKRKTQ